MQPRALGGERLGTVAGLEAAMEADLTAGGECEANGLLRRAVLDAIGDVAGEDATQGRGAGEEEPGAADAETSFLVADKANTVQGRRRWRARERLRRDGAQRTELAATAELRHAERGEERPPRDHVDVVRECRSPGVPPGQGESSANGRLPAARAVTARSSAAMMSMVGSVAVPAATCALMLLGTRPWRSAAVVCCSVMAPAMLPIAASIDGAMLTRLLHHQPVARCGALPCSEVQLDHACGRAG